MASELSDEHLLTLVRFIKSIVRRMGEDIMINTIDSDPLRSLVEINYSIKAPYFIGDKVEIVRGNFMKTTGYIYGYYSQDSARMYVEKSPQNLERGIILRVGVKNLKLVLSTVFLINKPRFSPGIYNEKTMGLLKLDDSTEYFKHKGANS